MLKLEFCKQFVQCVKSFLTDLNITWIVTSINCWDLILLLFVSVTSDNRGRGIGKVWLVR